MQRTAKPIGMLTTGLILMVVSVGVWLATATPASAQCGSQASSCKNCHEVQGEMPVNNDDSAWHPSHAFGDFCYICHGGNQQATDKDAAHQGMVDPLSDIQASCQQCHVNDLQQRAEVFANILGVQIGTGDSTSTDSSSTPTPTVESGASTTSTTSSVAVGLPAAGALVVDDADVVDYVQRYNEIVLGEKPINWGDLILIVLIALVIFGGGGFVLFNEGWLSITTKPLVPVPNGVQEDLVEMLPDLKRLPAKGRQGLKQLLQDPKGAAELFDVISRHTSKGE